jgi:hypothetical protein
MHLRWDRPFNAVIFVGSLFLLGLFLGFALLDTGEYKEVILDDPFQQIQATQYGSPQG